MAGIGGTVADLLDCMMLLDNELDTTTGAIDEATSIKALTQSQKYFETVAAMFPRVFQSTVNISTAANTETTAWNSLVRRLDALWLLDAGSKPLHKLERIDEVGGHMPALPWPLQISLSTGVGGPGGYYANMSNFYWLPLPDGVYSVRLYGLIAQPSFAARGDNFNYPDYCQLPIAQFACKLQDLSIDDDTGGLDELAQQVFKPLLRSVRKFDRSGPRSRTYSRIHDT